jgi:hypothetical protein
MHPTLAHILLDEYLTTNECALAIQEYLVKHGNVVNGIMDWAFSIKPNIKIVKELINRGEWTILANNDKLITCVDFSYYCDHAGFRTLYHLAPRMPFLWLQPNKNLTDPRYLFVRLIQLCR